MRSPEELLSRNTNILQTQPEMPSAACLVDDSILENSVLQLREPPDRQVDASFTRQIQTLIRHVNEIDPSIVTPPDLYLFTAYSAIPYADVLRGFFEAQGSKIPQIGYIKASRWKWKAPHEQNGEVARLKELTSGKKHVCVVDEHVVTARTILAASQLLGRAGVANVTAMRGTWDPYGVHGLPDVNLIEISHASLRERKDLHTIGVAAFHLSS